jgi:hypothetical protein
MGSRSQESTRFSHRVAWFPGRRQVGSALMEIPCLADATEALGAVITEV